MKKIILLILLNFLFYNTAFAESYYFKKCLLNETVSANYLINIEEKFINVIFESSDGKIQKVTDGIELIEKNKIISKKIKSSKSDDSYFIYYLDASSDSVIKQNYERQKIGEINLVKPVGEKIISKCKEVKADWDQVKKIEIIKKQIEEEEKKKKEEEKKMNEIKIKSEKKRKEQKNKYKVSIFGEKWIKLSEYNYDSIEKNKILKEFDKNAIEICLSNNKKEFNVIQKKIEIVETDDTPAWGTETVVKIGINGIIECK